MTFGYLDHLSAKLCVLDEEVNGFLVQTIPTTALIPHLLWAKKYFLIVAQISETKIKV